MRSRSLAASVQMSVESPRAVRALARIHQRHGEKVALTAEQLYDNKLWTENALVKISNMHTERAGDILRRMAHGESFPAANAASGDKFDTCGWGEIVSRLVRARGNVLATATRLSCQFKSLSLSTDQQQGLIENLGTAHDASVRLMSELGTVAPVMGVVKRASARHDGSLFEADARVPATRLISQMKAAAGFIAKCARDVPRLITESALTFRDRARINIEASRIISGCGVVRDLLTSDLSHIAKQHGRRNSDYFGVGRRYAPWLESLAAQPHKISVIATHANPDADALIASWLAERFLLGEARCHITFVSRNFKPSDSEEYNCVVDVGRHHDPGRRWFDHKPPAFSHRDESCASRLVYEYLLRTGFEGKRLSPLIDLVHDGDALTRRAQSSAYQSSRMQGLHAHIEQLRNHAENDQMLYQSVRLWLDSTWKQGSRYRNVIVQLRAGEQMRCNGKVIPP